MTSIDTTCSSLIAMEPWVSSVFAITEHRPWPLPNRPWVMRQTWHDLLFAHWPVPVALLRDHIPAPLGIDTYDGEAWIGVVPFRMTGVRPRLLPPLPWLSAFPELNVRTYVKRDAQPGVWFFSLDAGNPVMVEIARQWYSLPYFHAKMTLTHAGDRIHYSSRRTDRRSPPAALEATYWACRDGARSLSGSLEHWLTERYCLYSVDKRGRFYRADIHHRPWPLQAAEAEFRVNAMTAPLGIALPDTQPLLHFAKRLDVIIWNRKLCTGQD